MVEFIFKEEVSFKLKMCCKRLGRSTAKAFKNLKTIRRSKNG